MARVVVLGQRWNAIFSSLFVSSEYGSMWAVGAVGVLEERNACGRWVWGEGGKRACGGGDEGGGGGVRAVRAGRWGR